MTQGRRASGKTSNALDGLGVALTFARITLFYNSARLPAQKLLALVAAQGQSL